MKKCETNPLARTQASFMLKLLVIMKLTTFLLIFGTLQALGIDTYSQNARLTLDMDKVSVIQILDEIEKQSDFYFLFNHKLVDADREVNVHVEDKKIDEVLGQLFENTDIDFLVMDRQIVLSPKEYLAETKETIDLGAAVHQQLTVTGTVTDEEGEPMVGVNVVIVGTLTGVITDINGNYEIVVPSTDAELQFSFVGYVTETAPVEGNTTINMVLRLDVEQLEDIVVIGYGVQRKSNVTGSIVSVASDDLENRTTEDVGHSIQGKVAGVQVLATSGAPNAQTSFRIRGYSSTGSSNPLYIVDGLKVNDIGYLDQEVVESIEILKDASSAAIYGAEAGNGVVLITTKGAGRGAYNRLFFNSQFAFTSEAKRMDMMNAAQFKEYWIESGRANAASFGNADTDWQDIVFETGLMQKHTLGFQGGNDAGSLYTAMSYLENNGMVYGNKDLNQRFTAQVNASYKLKPWLTIGTTNSIERGKTSGISENNFTGTGSAIGGAYYYDPTVPVVYENDSDAPSYLIDAENAGLNVFRKDGKIYGASALMVSNLWNPLGMIAYIDNISTRTNLNGTIYGDLTPIEGLTLTSRLGYRIGNVYSTRYQYPYYWNQFQQIQNGTFQASNNHGFYYQWENFGNYLVAVGKLDFAVMAGMQYSRNNIEYQSGSTNKLINEDKNYRYLDYSSPDATDNLGGFVDITASISYFGRLSLTYDNRYTLQGIIRGDAYDLSKLSAKNRWGYFPSVSAGWTVTNEQFMENVNPAVLSNLKLRASWGINGNISSLRNYPYTSSLSLGSTGAANSDSYYSLTGTSGLITGAYPSDVLTNPYLTWEESKQVDIGVDALFIKNQLSFSADYFNKNTINLLSTVSAPAISGNTTQTINAGKINNSGLEFELSWHDMIGRLSYGVEANFSTIHNEVIESPYGETGRQAGGTNFFLPVTYFEKGYPVWYIRTYIHDHIDETTGLPVYKTAAELGTDDGKDFTGSGIPDYTYGLTVNLAYRGVDFKVFGTGVEGNENFLSVYRPDLPIANLPEYLYTDRWTATHTDAEYPRANQSDFQYSQSDFWVLDASYFKIKQIQLGYNLPGSVLKPIKVSALRAYVSLDNFFTFTKYPGNDPESMSSVDNGAIQEFAPGFGFGATIGLDRVNYPTMKSVVFGIDLSF